MDPLQQVKEQDREKINIEERVSEEERGRETKREESLWELLSSEEMMDGEDPTSIFCLSWAGDSSFTSVHFLFS